jgi:hypothetical protein
MLAVSREYALIPDIPGSVKRGFATGHPMWICPSSPVRFVDDRYRHHEGPPDGAYELNCYEGLYFHYGYSPVNSNASDPNRMAINSRNFTRPAAASTQFCSRKGSTGWSCVNPSTGVDSNNVIGAASWHTRNGYGPRPTVFLDGHVKIMASMEYRRHGNWSIMTGNNTEGQLVSGTATRKPFDFWLDEY